MAVLGAEFIRPDFDAGFKITRAQGEEARSFREAKNEANKWLRLKQQDKDAEAKNAAEIKRIDSQVALNKSSTIRNIFAAQGERNKLQTQQTIDTQAILTLDESRALTEKYVKDPSSVSFEDVRAMSFKLESLKGTTQAREAAAMVGHWQGVHNVMNSDFVVKNGELAKVAQAKGNLFNTREDAVAQNASGIYAIKPLITADGTLFTIDYDNVNRDSMDMAEALLDGLVAENQPISSLSVADRTLIRSVSRVDEDFGKRAAALAVTEGAARRDITKEAREDETQQERFLREKFINEEFEKRKEERGVKTFAEEQVLVKEIEEEFKARQPARVTTTQRRDEFGTESVSTTISGTPEAVSAEAEVQFGVLDVDFDDDITIAERPRGATDEQMFRIEANFRADLDDLDKEITGKVEELASGGERFGGIEDTQAAKDVLEEKRTALIERAASSGIDLRGKVSEGSQFFDRDGILKPGVDLKLEEAKRRQREGKSILNPRNAPVKVSRSEDLSITSEISSDSIDAMLAELQSLL